MKIRPFFRWYDLWIGAYWDRAARTLYLCPLPMVGLRIKFLQRGIFSIRLRADDSGFHTGLQQAAERTRELTESLRTRVLEDRA